MPKNRKVIFLVACGCSIATSTMVSEILKEDLVRQRKYRAEFSHCKTSELLTKVDLIQPDIVITTAPIDRDWIEKWKASGIYYFKGTPFLTGVGLDPIMKSILELMEEMNSKNS
jgi:galactitol-specific phosphotransferase system IIB component